MPYPLNQTNYKCKKRANDRHAKEVLSAFFACTSLLLTGRFLAYFGSPMFLSAVAKSIVATRPYGATVR